MVLLVPLANGSSAFSSNIPSLDNSGFQLWSQVNYNAQLAEGLYGYGEISIVARFGRNTIPENDVFVPIKAFLTYFPMSGLGLFGYFDYTPTFSDPNAFFFQAGGGIKAFPTDKWEIELSGANFWAGKNAGAGYSVNLGLGYRITPS